MRPLVIYHGNCADGFTAAWAVYKKYPNAIFHPGFYGENPPEVSGETVIIVDFSYKTEVLDEMAKSAKSILILDHHKSAAEDLAHYPEPPFLEDHYGWIPDSGIFALFDMNRSGARMAWDYFHGTEPSKLILHVEDRDLWKFEIPFSKEFGASLFSYEYTFDNWDQIEKLCTFEYHYNQFIGSGAAINRKHMKDVYELIKVCNRLMIIDGYKVPVASLPGTMASDAAGIMAINNHFAACYWDTSKGRTFSLRSEKDVGVDVSEIAKKYGGGGHKHASGFSVPRGHLLAKS